MSKGDIEKFEIDNFPDVNEQQRIVTKIDIGNQSTIIAFEKIAKMKKIEENFGFLKIK